MQEEKHEKQLKLKMENGWVSSYHWVSAMCQTQYVLITLLSPNHRRDNWSSRVEITEWMIEWMTMRLSRVKRSWHLTCQGPHDQPYHIINHNALRWFVSPAKVMNLAQCLACNRPPINVFWPKLKQNTNDALGFWVWGALILHKSYFTMRISCPA